MVADEVRSLAVRSASSVKETSGMVDAAIGNISNGNSLVEVTAKQLADLKAAWSADPAGGKKPDDPAKPDAAKPDVKAAGVDGGGLKPPADPAASMRVEAAGVYTIGLYDSLDDTETDVLFPLPVLKRNPLLQTRIP